MFDAYTVKKVLPRLVVAVILIQLSWFIFTGMIFLTNSIAYGIEGLIYGAFGGPEDFTLAALLSELDSQATGTFTTVAIGVAATVFSGGVFAVVFFIVMAVLVAFVTLAFRRMMLILLVLLAPIALVAWILPNTEKIWKMWWDNFTKLLLMYPIILAFIAIGRVFGKLAGTIGGSDIINTVIILAGYFLPLFLIPKTFSMAGSAFATVGGAVTQAGQKGKATGLGKTQEKWGNTRWGLRKQGKKDAKLNVRRQQETAKGVTSAMKGPKSIFYKHGLGKTGAATLEASAEKAQIDAAAQGHIQNGTNAENLVHIAATSDDKLEQQAALKALAQQGEGAYLIRAGQMMAKRGHHNVYDQALRNNYGEFASASAGATAFLNGPDGPHSQASLADAQAKKIVGQSNQELAAMSPRTWNALIEAQGAAASKTDYVGVAHARLDADKENPLIAAGRKVKTDDMAGIETGWTKEKGGNPNHTY